MLQLYYTWWKCIDHPFYWYIMLHVKAKKNYINKEIPNEEFEEILALALVFAFCAVCGAALPMTLI